MEFADKIFAYIELKRRRLERAKGKGVARVIELSDSAVGVRDTLVPWYAHADGKPEDMWSGRKERAL